MIGWLFRLIVGRFTSCRHEWQTVERVKRHDQESLNLGSGICLGHRYIVRCTKCGHIKAIDV